MSIFLITVINLYNKMADSHTYNKRQLVFSFEKLTSI